MNYLIDTTSRKPAYLQIYEQLRENIINGGYAYGSKLPSKRTLAAETGTSVITIKHAVELLCEEGYIEAHERSGYFVSFLKEDFLSNPSNINNNLLYDNSFLTSSDTNKGDFPFSIIAKTMRKVILDYNDKILIKSPNYGCMELRQEICAYLTRSRSIHISPDQVIIGSGAEYLYGLIAQLFDKGTKFSIENPSYNKIQKVYDAFNVSYDFVTLLSDGISSKDLKETKAKVLHTTPFNNYPTGITIGSSKKHEYIRWAQSRNGYIVEDNYDSELTVSSKPEDSLFSIANGENVIYINTFSRTIAPSIRIGYMILPNSLLKTFDTRLGFYSCTVPVFDQYVLTELLRSGDFERHVNRIRRKRRRELQ